MRAAAGVRAAAVVKTAAVVRAAALLSLLGLALPAPGAGLQSATYRVYVANESSDLVSRVAFTPGEGLVVENEIRVGIMPGDNDGAHGIAVAPDGQFWYVTIAHGTPYGYVWKFHAGPDTLVGRAQLGLFPATMGATPGGEFLLVANFNLHGDMTPSDVSVVYTPEMVEVARVGTCLMPHGSRVSTGGAKHYSVCMHSDELVEIDLADFRVSQRFSVAPSASESSSDEVCSPTWVEPAQGARGGRFVYVACNKSDQVLEVDVGRWEVVRRFATGAAPYNLEATTDGTRLLVTLKGEQGLAAYDLESGALLGRAGTSRPVTHGVVATPDGRWAFVSNESVGSVPGTLDVIDLETLRVAYTIELAHQSGGIDFWQPPPGTKIGWPGADPSPTGLP